MSLPSAFKTQLLHNRLGQPVELAVYHTQAYGRDYVFIAALAHQASSLVAKNAEHFAFQLREHFQLDVRRFELIEWRGELSNPELFRWRFEWVGNSPLSPRSEVVASKNQLAQLTNLLNIHADVAVVTA